MAKIFEKDDHKIIWGNALDVLSEEIKDNTIDLIFADPPTTLVRILMAQKINGILIMSI